MLRTKEALLLRQVGLDATIFLRFTRMLRNVFTMLALTASAVLIPVNIRTADPALSAAVPFFLKVSPQYLNGSASLWGYVAVAYVFNGIVCAFLWYNYRAVLRLKVEYYRNLDPHSHVEARTILMTNVPDEWRNDADLADLLPRTARAKVAPDVTPLEEMVKDRDVLVKDLEDMKRQRRYLKGDVGVQQRAIRQKTEQVRSQQLRISSLQKSLAHSLQPGERCDQARCLSYALATFDSASRAHSWAYDHRHGGPLRTGVWLIQGDRDLIWSNLEVPEQQRRCWRRYKQLLFCLLTIGWELPNALIAVFVANVSNLGRVWPQFQAGLRGNTLGWGIFQGLVPPLVTSTFYHVLPSVLRKLEKKSGCTTRTERDQYVLRTLLAFLIVNHLIVFSLFSTAWSVGTVVLHASRREHGRWHALWNDSPVQKVVMTVIQVTPYWCSWLLQRNLSS